MKFEHLIALLFGLCFTALGIFGVYNFLSDRFLEVARKTTGRVLESYNVQRSNSTTQNTFSYKPVLDRFIAVQFKTEDGKEVIARCEHDAEVGQELHIFYDPENPEKNFVGTPSEYQKGQRGVLMVSMIGMLLGLAIAFVGVGLEYGLLKSGRR